jgi:hypothetical protein
MSNRIRRAVFLYLISSAFLLLSHATTAQTPAATAQLKIDGSVATPLTLTVADLKAMPRKTLRVTNPHDKKVEVYEGSGARRSAPQGRRPLGRATSRPADGLLRHRGSGRHQKTPLLSAR